MRRRDLLATGLASPLVLGCMPQRWFTIGWDEQVQLLDGRVIVVKVKYKYQRLGSLLSFNRYAPSILRSTDFSFAAALPAANFFQTFERHRVNTLQAIDGHWYLILESRGGDFMQGKQYWGVTQDGNGHKCFRLDSTGLTSVPIDFFSDASASPNLLMDMAEADVLAAFDGTLVTLQQKAAYLRSHPLDPEELQMVSWYDSIMRLKAPGSTGSASATGR